MWKKTEEINGKMISKNLQREETQHLLENNKLTNNNLTNSESFLLLSFHVFFLLSLFLVYNPKAKTRLLILKRKSTKTRGLMKTPLT